MTRPLPDFLCPVISRVDIAWTCVATDDPNRLHLDPPFATGQAGHPDVIVPATMLIGWVGEYLEEIAGGAENIHEWKIRLVAPVWPGEQIRLVGRRTGEAEGATCGAETCDVTATTLEGKLVGRVVAVLRPCVPKHREEVGVT